MQFLTDNLFLIYILPLITAILALSANIFKYSISKNTVKVFSLISNLIIVCFASALTYFFYTDSSVENYSNYWNWLNLENINISFGFLADKVSSFYLLMFSIVAFIIQIAMINTLSEEKKINQYYSLFNALMFSMTAFIFSSNIIESVIITVIASTFCYLILNINYEKYNVSKYAHKFLTTDRIGDFCLFSAIIILIYFIKAYSLSFDYELLGFNNLTDIAADFYVYISDTNFYLLCLLFLIGIFAKAGMFPFIFKYIAIFYDYSPISYMVSFSMIVYAGIMSYRLLPFFDLSKNIIYTFSLLIGITLVYLLLLGILNKFYIKKDYSCLLYSMIGITFLAISIMQNTNHDSILHIEKYTFGIIAFLSVLFILFMISSLFDYYKNKESRQYKAEKDVIIENVFDWFVENIMDIPENIVRFTDKYVIPSFFQFLGYFARFISWIISCFQNGKVQKYILYMLIFTVLMLALYLYLLSGAGEV